MRKAKLIPKNKILSVTVKRVVDNDPDTSWLGEYASSPSSEFSIDRAHSLDCVLNGLTPAQEAARDKLQRVLDHLDDARTVAGNDPENTEWESLDDAMDTINQIINDIEECDRGERGDMERNQYQYFNPSFNYVGKDGKPTDGLTPEEVREYTRQDYERLERLNSGDWCFIGVTAQAEIGIPQNNSGSFLLQTLHSGGLYGIESDSERSYIESEEKNQLADLCDVLKSFGFSSRSISQAFKSVERKES